MPHTCIYFPGDENGRKLWQKQKIEKKKFCIQRVPWPDHPCTTERNLKSSQLLLQTVPWHHKDHINVFVQQVKIF